MIASSHTSQVLIALSYPPPPKILAIAFGYPSPSMDYRWSPLKHYWLPMITPQQYWLPMVTPQTLPIAFGHP